MSLAEHEKLKRQRRALLVTMGVILAVFAAGMGVAAYPWETIVIHNVSLALMLRALLPLAALMSLAVLFLHSAAKTAVALERAERELLAAWGLEEAEMDGRDLAAWALAAAGAAEGQGQGRVEWQGNPSPVRGGAAQIKMALAALAAASRNGGVLVARGAETPEGGLALSLAPAQGCPSAGLAEAASLASKLLAPWGARVHLAQGGVEVVFPKPQGRGGAV
ncbi:MAG TPA: hypothetical protein P5137_02640 [Candidatus Brocadiia bacterium]|nr:hypothetical protein [Candidatus Brocadiia bacterium]